MTLRSASYSPKHTENMPITAIQKACQSVSHHCLSCSIEQGNLWEKTARTHRLGLYLKSKDRRLSRNIAKKSVITNSMQLTKKKNAEFYEKNHGVSKWIFVKFINKVLQRWRNYENSKVLPSIRSQDGSSSRTRTLSWKSASEYKNCKMK